MYTLKLVRTKLYGIRRYYMWYSKVKTPKTKQKAFDWKKKIIQEFPNLLTQKMLVPRP